MRTHLIQWLLAALCTMPAALYAQQTPKEQQPANEQVIEPKVDRRDIRVPRFPSKDFSAGLFAGTYSAENFGSSPVYGLRLGYHITEDFFVEGVYARTEVSDELFRQILPGGIFERPEETLTYYNLSAGVNILPGEVFIWRCI
jgi:hypothetical protein